MDQNEPDKDLKIKYLDLLSLISEDRFVIPAEGNQENMKNTTSNFRSYLVANVMIVGQYISVFEGTRRSTQEILCVSKEWARELKILSCFMTAFNECNHKITDQFFTD